MAIQLDLSNIPDPNNVRVSGERPEPGRGMAKITAWREYGGASGKAHELELEIVAWTEKGCVGKTHKENIFHTDSTGKGFPTRRLTCLAMAAGILTVEEIERCKASGQSPEIDFSKIVERPIMIILSREQDKDDPTKSYVRIGEIGLAFYHIKDPKTNDWPKNQSIYNRFAGVVGNWGTGSPSKIDSADASSKANSNPFFGNI